jgi:hypothetical protein
VLTARWRRLPASPNPLPLGFGGLSTERRSLLVVSPACDSGAHAREPPTRRVKRKAREVRALRADSGERDRSGVSLSARAFHAVLHAIDLLLYGLHEPDGATFSIWAKVQQLHCVQKDSGRASERERLQWLRKCESGFARRSARPSKRRWGARARAMRETKATQCAAVRMVRAARAGAAGAMQALGGVGA